ncbi:MAG: pentapeptide repeat-containing protein, partial [Candidatus Poribacteria bacterium]|nr:pentapeptide repeat-containing protein [Candidatus Poribacteria bacterium]
LTGTYLRNAILVGANLSGANLNGADLSRAYLYKAKLIGANLRDANFYGARLSEADLTEANLVGARINLAANRQDGTIPIKSGISIQLQGDYREITSFHLNGVSNYMTSKSGQLYRSNETGSDAFGDYVRRYPDLLVAYKKSSGKSIEAWGKHHWETFGQHENRSLRDIPHFEVVLDLNKNPKFRSDEEVGLLSVVARDDLIYLSYTIKESDKDSWDDIFLVVDEYNVKLEKLRTIIKIRTASFAHVAGTLTFDRVGNLYLSVGEGRLSDYESQNIDSLLGKILRIDVSKASPKAKVIAYGLRNPWKISIDSENRMFIGDCGEATIESVYLLDD